MQLPVHLETSQGGWAAAYRGQLGDGTGSFSFICVPSYKIGGCETTASWKWRVHKAEHIERPHLRGSTSE